jgi:hypothetical protein
MKRTAILALSWAGTVAAACNNPKNWLESPNFFHFSAQNPGQFTETSR